MGRPISLKETVQYLYGISTVLRKEYFDEMLRLTQHIYKISKEELLKEIDNAWN